MSAEEREAALAGGRTIVKTIHGAGCNTIGFGEMGISNTSSASLIMSSILGLPVAQCVGKGTGTNDEQLRIKTATLQQVTHLHNIQALKVEPEALLAAVGGFEIAMMCGAYLQAAEQGMVILVDGFIATAALLLAHAMEPKVRQHCLFAHCSDEAGHHKMLDYLGAKPLLQLGLRLGEGTGAALAVPLVQAAVNFMNEMASFAAAGIEHSTS
jgi:nicotinate-nucleotide--dimethylbenzimidazole phosphoribosyltransferase